MLLSGCQSANQRVEADAILRPNVVAAQWADLTISEPRAVLLQQNPRQLDYSP